MDLFLKSGIFGLLIVAFFVLLLMTGIVVVAITRSRRATITFALLAFAPLFLGLCGTYLGNRQVDRIAGEHGLPMPAEGPHYSQSAVAAGRREAWSPTYLGSGATAALLVVFGFAFALTKKV